MLRFLAESEPRTGYATVLRSLDVDGWGLFNLEGILKALDEAITRKGESSLTGEMDDGEMAPIAMSWATTFGGFAGRLLLKRIVEEWRDEDFRQSEIGKSGCDHQ